MHPESPFPELEGLWPDVRVRRKAFAPALAGLTGAVLVACGAGTAAIVAGSGGGDNGGAPATLTTFELQNPKVSPATLHLEASESVLVELFYALDGGPLRPMTALTGVNGNQVQLAPQTNDLEWDFAAEFGPEYESAVDLVALRTNGTPISGGSLNVGLGNDVPVVLRVEPTPTDPSNPSESSGNVEVRLKVSDSSSDVVTLAIEWRRASDDPDSWLSASAAGVLPEGIETSPGGVELSFFWATNVDLDEGDEDVYLRVTPNDRTLDSHNEPVGFGAPVESRLFRIDNNEPPIVVLNNEQWLLNSDEREALPIPFLLTDAEGDELDVLLQWRRSDEAEWPTLPTDAAALRDLLRDPEREAERLALHLCSSAPLPFDGRLAELPDGLEPAWSDPLRNLRLPELATTAAALLDRGRGPPELELLRDPIPQLAEPWADALASPVAVLFVEGSAWILESSVPGWSVREYEPRTGKAGATLASGVGQGTALARIPGSQSVLVAAVTPLGWTVARQDPDGGTREEWSGPATDVEGIRALLPLDRARLLFTEGSSVWLLDLSSGNPARQLLEGLSHPWGLAQDPTNRELVYVAEHGADRIRRIDLRTLVMGTVPAGGGGSPAVVRPRALAVMAPDRLLVMTEPEIGTARLLALRPRAAGSIDADHDADALSVAIPLPTNAPAAALACGAHETLLVVSPSSDRPALGGGIARTVAIAPAESSEQPFAHEPAHQVVRLAEALDHEPQAGTRWRIAHRPSRFLGDPQVLAPRAFLWDSRDLVGGGEVIVRILALDSDVGISSAGIGAKTVRTALDIEPNGVSSALQVDSLAVGDVDGDGDLDLAAAGRQDVGLWLHYNDSGARPFERGILLTNDEVQDEPSGVSLADIDGDGRFDVIGSLRRGQFVGGQIAVFYQTSPGTFGGFYGNNGFANAEDIQAADLDGDELLDIVTNNPLDDGIFLTFQVPGPDPFPTHQLLRGLVASQALATCDLDRDGDLDVVVANGTNNSVATVLQTGFRTFVVSQTVSGPVLPWDVAAGDLDLDGRLELVSANREGNDVTVFRANAGGLYSLSERLGGSATTPLANSVCLADLDGNGELDIAASAESTPEISLFLQQAGVFSRTALAPSVSGASWRTLAAGDIEGNGEVELIAADGAGHRVFTFSPRRPAGRAPSLTNARSLPGPNDARRRTLAADLDDDGDVDIASGEGVNDSLRLWFQSAPEVFGAGVRARVMQEPRALAALDADGDGDLDLAVVEGVGDQILVLSQVAPGTFEMLGAPLQGGSAAAGMSELVSADLDGDGRIDLCTANAGSGSVTTFANGPLGFTGPEVVLDSLSGLPALLARDLDRDGIPDLVASSLDDATVRILRGSRDGGFEITKPFGAGATPAPIALACADLDHDGRLDLLVDASATELRTFLQGEDDEFLANPSQILPIGTAVTLDAGDVNGDGWSDALSTDFLSNSMAFTFGHGSGYFESAVARVTLQFPTAVLSGSLVDLDGDGSLDVLTTHTASSPNLGPIRIFYGNH